MPNFLTDSLDITQMLGIATEQFTEQERLVQIYRQFYNGDQGIKLTQRQFEYLLCDAGLPDAFVNVCKMVVATIKDRLNILPQGLGIVAVDESTSAFADLVSTWWVKGQLDRLQSELHQALLRDGSAVMFVEWDGELPIFTVKELYDGTEGVRFHNESNADDTHFDFASYQWVVEQLDLEGQASGAEYLRVNIYIPGSNEDGNISNATVFRFKGLVGSDIYDMLTPEEIRNELGTAFANPQVLPIRSAPLVKFINTDEMSELEDILRIQQLINKAIGDIDIASDFHGYPVFTADSFAQQTDAQGNAVEQAIEPGAVITAPGAKRVEPANLELMWKGSILPYIDMISLIKKWPAWILRPSEFVIPSGTALRVAEKPLSSQIASKQGLLTPQWLNVFDVAAQWLDSTLENQTTGSIFIKWQPAAIENIIEDTQIQVQTAKQAGLPFKTILSLIYGFDKEQIDDIFNALNQDIDYKQQQAEILETLSKALVDPATASKFLLGEDDTSLAEFGSITEAPSNEPPTIEDDPTAVEPVAQEEPVVEEPDDN